MFDAILENVASRFGISPDKARQLLGSLTALIFNPDRGGPSGFVDRLRSSGLGDTVQSWIGDGPNQPVSPGQLESALGSGEIADIASKTGLDTATAGNALSGMLPDVFDRLTGDGRLPTSIPASLGGMLGGLGDRLGDLGRSGAAAIGAGAASIGAGAATLGGAADNAGDRVAAAVSTRDGDTATRSGGSKWWGWILLLAVLALGWYFLRGCQRAPVDASVETPATATSDVTTPADDAMAAATDTTGMPAAGDGTVPADAMATDPAAAGTTPDSMAADPAAAGTAPDAMATDPATMEPPTPADAGAEFDRLAASGEPMSADALVKALNLMIIHFDTGSARISADSLDILQKAAIAIKAAPAGTRIEVGGHTDNTGNAAANQRLSQARAEAVVAQLVDNGIEVGMLGSKGYGQDKPVADNGTAEGRAENRRIEFSVQQ